MNHFDFTLPFNSELNIPYRVHSNLQDKIYYIFTHPKVNESNRDIFINILNSGSKSLLNDMGCIAVACCNEYISHPVRYGNKYSNIYLQILVRMWKQTFKHSRYQEHKIDMYYPVKVKLLSIDNGFFDELFDVCINKDYIQSNDDMVKKRDKVSLRGRRGLGTHEGSSNFEYLCSLI